MDPILGQYFKDGDAMVLFPIQTRDDVEKQFPETRIKFLTYEQFAQLDFVSLLEIKDLEAETLKATTFASSYIENVGDGKFKLTPLPSLCQMSSINEILIDDFNEDNILDALLVGNDFFTESNYGRLDACTGIFLKGTETGFEAIPSRESGFYVPEQSNALLKIKDRQGRSLILAGQNNEKIKVFE